MNNYYDFYIKDYVFSSNYITLQKAESREKGWYIMYRRMLNPNDTINMSNFNQKAPLLWKQQLKSWLMLPLQKKNSFISIDFVHQVTDRELQAATETLLDCLWGPYGDYIGGAFSTLYASAKAGTFVKSGNVSKNPETKAMWNGIKTEYIQAAKRALWAHDKNLDVYLTLNSSLNPNIATNATFDIALWRDPNKVAPNWVKTIDFEEKTHLKHFHMASATDPTRQTLTAEFKDKTIDDIAETVKKLKVQKLSVGRWMASLVIDQKKLDQFITSLLDGRLKDYPIYESPFEIKLPSELLADIMDAQNHKLKIYLDELKLLGQKIVNGKLQQGFPKSIKYHVWYGR